MIPIAVAMFVFTLVAFVFGLLGLAGLTPEIGWLFAFLSLTFLVVAVQFSFLDAQEELAFADNSGTRMFGGEMRMNAAGIPALLRR